MHKLGVSDQNSYILINLLTVRYAMKHEIKSVLHLHYWRSTLKVVEI